MSTRVVHCKREPFDVYIGRPSKWGNPYSHKPNTAARHRVATIAQALERYETWLRGQRDLMRSLHELRGKVLGCWCKPGPCHGDVLARMADELGDAMGGDMSEPKQTCFCIDWSCGLPPCDGCNEDHGGHAYCGKNLCRECFQDEFWKRVEEHERANPGTLEARLKEIGEMLSNNRRRKRKS